MEKMDNRRRGRYDGNESNSTGGGLGWAMKEPAMGGHEGKDWKTAKMGDERKVRWEKRGTDSLIGTIWECG